MFVLFAVSYGILWLLGTVVLGAWVSPMHWIVPIAAFFLSFWLLDWVERFFEIRVFVWWFPLLLVFLGLLAFYVNAWFYYCNGFTDISTANVTCDSAGSKRALDFINTNFWNLLNKDAFFYFWLAVLFAWLSRLVWQQAFMPQQASAGAKAMSKNKNK